MAIPDFDYNLAGEMTGDYSSPYTPSSGGLNSELNLAPSEFSNSYNYESPNSNTGSSALDMGFPEEYFGNTAPNAAKKKESEGWMDAGISILGGLFGGGSGGSNSGIWSALISAGVGMAKDYLQQDATKQVQGFDSEQAQKDRDLKAELAQKEREMNLQMNAERIAASKEIANIDARAGLAREAMGGVSSLANTRANVLGNRAANRTLTTNIRSIVDALR